MQLNSMAHGLSHRMFSFTNLQQGLHKGADMTEYRATDPKGNIWISTHKNRCKSPVMMKTEISMNYGLHYNWFHMRNSWCTVTELNSLANTQFISHEDKNRRPTPAIPLLWDTHKCTMTWSGDTTTEVCPMKKYKHEITCHIKIWGLKHIHLHGKCLLAIGRTRWTKYKT